MASSSAKIEELKARIAQIEGNVCAFGNNDDRDASPNEAAQPNDEATTAYPVCLDTGCGDAWPAFRADRACLVQFGDYDSGHSRGQGSKRGESFEKPKDESSAYQRILRIVGTREQSSAKVRDKLLRAGFEPDVAQRALEKAIRVGVVDDRRYCEALISSALRSCKGLTDVLREVESLGVSPEELDSYQVFVEEGLDGQIARARQFLEAHPVRSKNQRDGAYRKLISRGYPSSVASAVAGEVYPHRL